MLRAGSVSGFRNKIRVVTSRLAESWENEWKVRSAAQLELRVWDEGSRERG
jgi:hypothetical protein